MKKPTSYYNTVILADEMKYNGVTLLNYRIEYPEFIANNYRKTAKLVNQYYEGKALALQKEIRTKLYRMAVDQYQDDIKNDYPVRIFEALQTFKVTYNQACIISLYLDNYQFTGGAHGSTARTSQSWNLRSGRMISLKELYRCPGNYKSYVKNKVTEQIKDNPDIYFENYNELVEQTFNTKSFYCTPEGVVVYFQQYDIAPYSSGIREFLLPYNKCLIDPLKKCQRRLKTKGAKTKNAHPTVGRKKIRSISL